VAAGSDHATDDGQNKPANRLFLAAVSVALHQSRVVWRIHANKLCIADNFPKPRELALGGATLHFYVTRCEGKCTLWTQAKPAPQAGIKPEN
jgi:hypothetical protein